MSDERLYTPAEVAAREAAAREAGMRKAAGIAEAHAQGSHRMKDSAGGPNELSGWITRANAFEQAAAAILAAIEKKEPTT